ncbi:MAG: DUF2523 family protein [Candidatus Nanopelagicaceae bacterium]|nr:DUF2523 family protein [Candidatus Nanopelagicaceae bacterium]
MGDLASWFWGQIKRALVWIGDLFTDVFIAAWDFFMDGVSWVFDKLLDLAVSAVGGMSTGIFTDAAQAFQLIPPDVLQILSLLGVGQCIAIITAAITIRLVLQLIPFVRLGS